MNDLFQTIGGDDHSESGSEDSRERLAPGSVLNGEYELVKQLGRGGMGVVWEARELLSGRTVALKFVPRDLQRFESEMIRMREAFGKVHALQHEHICPLYGLKSDPLLGYYLVMKWLTGESLDTYLMRVDPERNGIDPIQTIKILTPVALALDYAHKKKIIHRDIKPSNIFLILSADGREIEDVQVIDFGLAGEIKASMSRVSQAMLDTSGTRPYMAPEQWRGRQQTAATDQYALAVVAYEMMAGHLPFEGGDLEMLRMAVLQDKPEPVRGLDKDINATLQKALAKDAVDRFANCMTFMRSLFPAPYITAELVAERKSTGPFCSPTMQHPQRSNASPPPKNDPNAEKWRKEFDSFVEKYRDTFSAKKDKEKNNTATCLGCGCLLIFVLWFMGCFMWFGTAKSVSYPQPNLFREAVSSHPIRNDVWPAEFGAMPVILQGEATGIDKDGNKTTDTVSMTIRQKTTQVPINDDDSNENTNGAYITISRTETQNTCDGKYGGSQMFGDFQLTRNHGMKDGNNVELGFRGEIMFGETSGFPNGTKAPYEIKLNATNYSKFVDGEYTVGEFQCESKTYQPQQGKLSLQVVK